jgi:hypothetical protein
MKLDYCTAQICAQQDIKAHTFRNHIRPRAFDTWLRGLNPYPLSPSAPRSREPTFCRGTMNTEKFEGEGWRTLWLAIAGVMAITLTWNVLMLSLNGISF